MKRHSIRLALAVFIFFTAAVAIAVGIQDALTALLYSQLPILRAAAPSTPHGVDVIKVPPAERYYDIGDPVEYTYTWINKLRQPAELFDISLTIKVPGSSPELVSLPGPPSRILSPNETFSWTFVWDQKVEGVQVRSSRYEALARYKYRAPDGTLAEVDLFDWWHTTAVQIGPVPGPTVIIDVFPPRPNPRPRVTDKPQYKLGEPVTMFLVHSGYGSYNMTDSLVIRDPHTGKIVWTQPIKWQRQANGVVGVLVTWDQHDLNGIPVKPGYYVGKTGADYRSFAIRIMTPGNPMLNRLAINETRELENAQITLTQIVMGYSGARIDTLFKPGNYGRISQSWPESIYLSAIAFYSLDGGPQIRLLGPSYRDTIDGFEISWSLIEPVPAAASNLEFSVSWIEWPRDGGISARSRLTEVWPGPYDFEIPLTSNLLGWIQNKAAGFKS